jgi:membrane fusion protein (multidrug efflux system)
MATGFHHTLRTLRADGFGRSLASIGVVALLIGAWAAWCVRGKISLYETSTNARLEIDRAAYAVQSPLGGNVTGMNLAIGREVKRGDVLFELDSRAEELQRDEERSRLGAMEREIDALRSQIAVEEKARLDEQRMAGMAEEVARANAREAEALAGQAAAEAARLTALRAGSLISVREYEAGQSEGRRRRAAADSMAKEVQRVEEDRRAKDSERGTRIRKLETDISRLAGQAEVARSTLARLGHEVERRKVRAATDGRIGEAAVVRAGGVVGEGERLGSIVPEGQLAVVAQFPPPAALGRLRPGQHARLRLTGYPWIQYGAVAATVARVSSEVRDGSVRVELTVDAAQNTTIPLQHGLPGSVEVEVERISPARLLTRLAGRTVAGQ